MPTRAILIMVPFFLPVPMHNRCGWVVEGPSVFFADLYVNTSDTPFNEMCVGNNEEVVSGYVLLDNTDVVSALLTPQYVNWPMTRRQRHSTCLQTDGQLRRSLPSILMSV